MAHIRVMAQLVLLVSVLAPSFAFSDPAFACEIKALEQYILSTGFMFNPSVLDRPATLTGISASQYSCITSNRPIGTPTVRTVLCQFCRINYCTNPAFNCP